MPDWKEAIRDHLLGANLDPASENSVVEELSQHLEERYQELEATGMPAALRRRKALEELSSQDVLGRVVRQARGRRASSGAYLQGFAHDLKIACRNIGMKPAFSLMVIAMLAAGVAGNAAIFSIFNSLFLRPLPFPESDRLVDLDETAPKWSLKFVGVASADFVEWRKSNSTFDSMASFRAPGYNLSIGGAVERVTAAQVTRDMLDVLRLKPAIGRNFTPEEDKPGGPKVVLLTDGLWRRLFQADRNMLGRVVKLDEEAYTVIGILPPDAVFPGLADLWMPLQADPNNGSSYYLSGIGRLKAGVSVEQARADLLRVHRGLISEGRKVNEITSPVVTPMRDRYLGNFRTVSHALLGAVAVILLIACVNIAALMMVRGSYRSREFGSGARWARLEAASPPSF